MPKGKAKQRQAGTAAVPTASTPAFTPPGPEAHAQYQQLVTIFTRAFQQAGVKPEKGIWDVWRRCCQYTGSLTSLMSVFSLVSTLMSKAQGPAFPLMALFIQRTLVLAGIHEHVFHTLKNKPNPADRDVPMYILILKNIIGSSCITEVPEECRPDPATQSYAALAHIHWHPRIIEISCRALLCTDDPGAHSPMITFLQLLHDPKEDAGASSESAALAAPAKVDFDEMLHQVLQDRSCMSAIWSVLQHKEHNRIALRLLGVLQQATSPLNSVDHLLSIGAACSGGGGGDGDGGGGDSVSDGGGGDDGSQAVGSLVEGLGAGMNDLVKSLSEGEEAKSKAAHGFLDSIAAFLTGSAALLRDGSGGGGGGGGGGKSNSKCTDPPERAAEGSGSGSVEAEAGSSAQQCGSINKPSTSKPSTSKPNRACISCGRVGKMKACSRCGAPFCDASCQRSAWPSHRKVCVPKGPAVP